MTLKADELEKAASDLFEAEKSGVQIGLLSQQYPSMNMDDAYEVQKRLIDKKLAGGRKIIGWKIGLTSRPMQRALNIETPDSGVLFDDMVFENGSTVPRGRFIQPRIEAEIAFEMKSALHGKVSREEVLEATQHVVPSIEILDTRVTRLDAATGAARIVTDTISDNAANAGIVLGDQRHAPDSVDLRWTGAIVSNNGVVEETGLGAAVLNDPVRGIQWLCERMDQYGQKIEAGQVILSGSFIAMLEAPSGSSFHADFGSFGEVNIAFE